MDFQELNNRVIMATAKWSFGARQRSDLYKMLAAMLNNNLSLSAGLSRLLRLYAPRKHPLVPILNAWSSGMAEGRKFSEVAATYVPREELVLIAAGERSNQVATGLMQASNAISAKTAMRSAVFASLAQPTALLLMVFGVLVGFSIWMAPTISSIFPAEKFPASVRALFSTADFLRDYWWILVSLGGACATAVGWSLGNWTGPWRAKVDKLPPWSIYRTYTSATFMIALASLLRAGVPLPEAIRNIRSQSSPWMRQHLALSLRRLEDGDSYEKVFDTGMLDGATYDLVAIYAELSDFDAAIKSIGESSIQNSTESIQRKSVVVKNVALVSMAVLIGWIYSSIFAVNQLSKDLGKAPTSISSTK